MSLNDEFAFYFTILNQYRWYLNNHINTIDLRSLFFIFHHL
ncbi:hypothetical protein PROSTU_04198 [Providencia stuartii ATCC 25827]|uniref:Uncharacterized protein n=1 Tax=Providencia stuartii ATCC 25827 TaxID=471874 RepID=A0AA87CPF1_PROST|nr:hypothetical protein PROSTU_04198 [Providencia stuartii ATCC 25827]